MGNATDGDERLTVRVDCGFDCYGVDHGGGFHPGYLVPTTSHPITRLVIFDEFGFYDPFWLLHSIPIWNVDPQRKAVCRGQRPAIPCIGEHDALIGGDEIERNCLIEPIDRGDFEKSGLLADVRIPKNATDTDS